MPKLTKEMIDQMVEEYVACSRNGNHDGVSDLYTEDAQVTMPDSCVWIGRKEIREALIIEYGSPVQPQLLTEIIDVTFDANGKNAIVTERFTTTQGSSTEYGLAIMHVELIDEDVKIRAEMIVITKTS